MSQENVEVVRRVYDAANRGDGDGLLELVDPDIRYDLSERVFNPAVYEGHEGIRRFAAETEEIWDDFRTEPLDFIDCGDEIVVSHLVRGTGKGSGVEVELPSTVIYALRRGKVVSIRMYREHREALKAVGLLE
jgi:ketosteroid isomerase-like protein